MSYTRLVWRRHAGQVPPPSGEVARQHADTSFFALTLVKGAPWQTH